MWDLFRGRFRKMHGQFRSHVWDPVLLTSQMLSMQCLFYVSSGFWLILMDYIGGFDMSLDQLFDPIEMNLSDNSGRITLAAFGFNSLTCALGLWVVIQRTKLCLDFASTIHCFHLIICWIYSSHIPSTASWWVLNILCLALMTVLGEFLCMRSELKAIPVGMGPKVDL